MNYKIKVPIWSSRSIGINEAQLDEYNTIQILYKDKTGKRLYPKTYTISKNEALNYPTQVLESGTVLRIIPIYDLETKFRKSNEDFEMGATIDDLSSPKPFGLPVQSNREGIQSGRSS